MQERVNSTAAGSSGTRLERGAWLLALVAALAYLLMLGVRPYAGDVILKTSMCVLLAFIAWRAHARLLTLALLFSAAGDAFLAIDGEKLFIPGLASFLITHVIYTVIFVRGTRSNAAEMRGWRQVALIAIPLFSANYSFVLWPHLGGLALPVVLYSAAIAVMAMLSLRVQMISVPLGALLFMASDSLIAYEMFLTAPPWVSPTVWATYAAAQLLIVRGLLHSRSA